MRFPIFAALKSLQAELSGDASWRALRAPLPAACPPPTRARSIRPSPRAGIVPGRDGA